MTPTSPIPPAPYPYAEIEFTKEGTVFQPTAVDALLKTLTDTHATDLLVMSHGWNNDMKEARDLYNQLVPLIAAEVTKRPELAQRKFAVLGVLWPSKKFTDDELIPGGGAASFTMPAPTDPLIDRLNELEHFFDGTTSTVLVKQAIQAAQEWDTDPNAPDRFVTIMETLLAQAASGSGPGTASDEPEDFSAGHVRTSTATDLLTGLSDVQLAEPVVSTGGAADMNGTFTQFTTDGGGAAGGFLNNLSGLVSGARNLLNFVTYYQMKERAGKVGVLGLNPILGRIRHDLPACRIHLIGHSFGARLVTAAAAGSDDASVLPVQTLSLLQGAFSHYGFAGEYEPGKGGFFRSVPGQHKVTGPIIITQTHNDKAVGVAYAIASRIAGQVGSFLGDPDDFYGGMGANGAQKSNADTSFTLDSGPNFAFKPATIYNLNADHWITGHSDLFHPQVASAIVSAIAVG